MAELISNPIRIPCGGFDIDNDTLYFQNDVLKSKREEPELPLVSAVDDGDVLTVVDGAWAKATPTGGVLIVHDDIVTGALDKTWQEIYDAGFSVLQLETTFLELVAIGQRDDSFFIAYFGYGQEQPLQYVANSANGYPLYIVEPIS